MDVMEVYKSLQELIGEGLIETEDHKYMAPMAFPEGKGKDACELQE